MSRRLLKFVAHVFTNFGFWIVVGLAVIAIGHYALVGVLASFFMGVGFAMLTIGYVGMGFRRARRMHQHKRDQRNSE